MKQSLSLLTRISMAIFSFSLLLASCSKKDKVDAPVNGAFAGQYLVEDDDETYTLRIEHKGGNEFHIKEFGGFLNAALKANLEGNVLKIPSQTFTNAGTGNSITIVGTGVLSTKTTKDDTVTFQYSLTGFGAHDGSFAGSRK